MKQPDSAQPTQITVSTLLFLMTFTLSSVNIALPAIGKEIKMDSAAMSWMATSFLLSSAILLLPAGKWADMHGRKSVMICGGVVFTAASFLLALADSSAILICLRALQGVGAGMVWATSSAILVAAFPIEQRGMALGVNSAAVFLGYTAGPLLGGWLTQQLGWRSIFLANVPVAIIITLYGIRVLKTDQGRRGADQTFDLGGAVLSGGALIALIYGVGLLPDFSGVLVALVGVAGMGMFVRRETRNGNPLFDVTLFKRNRIFTLCNFVVLANFSATFGISYLMSLYLQYIKGMSAQEAGLLLITNPLAQAVASPVAGWISDRLQPRWVSAAGFVVAVSCLLGLSQLGPQTPLPYIIIDLAALGLALATVLAPNSNASMSSVDPSLFGVASATSGVVRVVGQMSSMAIAMVVFALFLGRASFRPENYPLLLQSIQVSFIIFGLLSLSGLGATLVTPNLPRHRQVTEIVKEVSSNLDVS